MDHSDDIADPNPGDRRDGNAGRIDGGEVDANEASGAESGADRGDHRAAARSGPHGSDLSPSGTSISDLALFFDRAQAAGSGEAPRGRFARALDLGGNAAFVLCVLGFAFAAGTYFFGGPPGGLKLGATQQLASQDSLDRAEMLRKTQKMVEDISALKSNVDALRASVAQEQASTKDQHGVEKSVDALKAKIDSVKAETSGALAELSSKVDRLQRDPTLKQVADRLDRIEKQTATAVPTGSVDPMVKAATQNRNQAAQAKTAPSIDPPKRLALITDWVVRDVYDGVALVENARGSIEVALGDAIPGAGTVRAIERRGGGWIVITTRGVVDYDHSIMTP